MTNGDEDQDPVVYGPGSKFAKAGKYVRSRLIDTAVESSGSHAVTLVVLSRDESCHLNQITGAEAYIDHLIKLLNSK